MKRFLSTWFRRFWPLFAALVLYALALSVTRLIFGEGPRPKAIPADLLLYLSLALLLAGILVRRWVFVVVLSGVTAFLHLGHAVKIMVLGAPMSPDDIHALQALVLIVEPWQRLLLLTVAFLLLGAFFCGIGWKNPRRLAVLGMILVLGGALTTWAKPLTAWMDQRFGYVDWNPTGDYRRRGPTLHSLQEISRFLATRKPLPTRDEVASVLLDRTVFPQAVGDSEPLRNIHFIVLESFWDAGQLKAVLDQDPLPPDFRRLWAEAGHSRALSPVFGGYTANAEFEALCGFPVTENSVRFERNVIRDVACLPEVLRDGGYLSIASHPNTPAFWNRHNVYGRIGFDRFWAGSDFVYDDMNGGYLSDRSLYRQVLEKVDPLLKGDRPIFNYVLTFFGHLPYPLSEDRPRLFESRSAFPDVAGYVNTLHYKAKELMEFLAVLRERDPEALIVVFGDHLPFLGGRYGAYLESGLVAGDKADFTAEMLRDLTATPLLIIDGRLGPVAVGDLPLYRLPSLVLDLLGNRSRTLMAYTQPPAGMQVRPLPGMHLNLYDNGVEACRAEPWSNICRQSADWLGQVDILATDLFVGSQYALPKNIDDSFDFSRTVERSAEEDLPAQTDGDELAEPSEPS